MVKITDLIKIKYYLPNKRNIMIVALLIVFTGILVYFYSKFSKKRKESSYEGNVSNANMREKTADIFFFHADWCPHCLKALPTWKTFVDAYDKKVVNGYKLNCIGGRGGIDCSNEDDPKTEEIRKKYNVNSFPTLKMNKDDTVIDFGAKISAENLSKFVNVL